MGVPSPARTELRRLRRAGGGDWAVAFRGLNEAENKRKRKEVFAKRNERFRSDGRKSLRSLGREINEFREIGCFQGVNRLFVSRFRRMRSLDPKKAKPSGPPFDKLRAGFRDRSAAPWGEALDRAVFSGARIASAGRGLEKAARRHGGESVRTSPR